MKRTLTLLAICLVGATFLLPGCQQPEEKKQSIPATAEIKAGAPSAGAKRSGGGVPDMADYPAPSGVKTGIEGGRK